MEIQMNTLGLRLRSERERLDLSQMAFGKVGGVESNAQGKYEANTRLPNAIYFAALSEIGVDILFIITGSRDIILYSTLSKNELSFLTNYRTLRLEHKIAIDKLAVSIAELSAQKLRITTDRN